MVPVKPSSIQGNTNCFNFFIFTEFGAKQDKMPRHNNWVELFPRTDSIGIRGHHFAPFSGFRRVHVLPIADADCAQLF